MGINKENYEAYFLDYQEGNLGTEQVAELMVFLEVYPNLKAELEAFESITLTPDNDIRLENKNFLKKKNYLSTQNINSSNYEEWLVAHIEGDLNNQETNELNEFLEKNPTARLELNIFRKTVLIPETIELENKQSLKKTGIFLLYGREITYAVSIAATLLLFFGLYFTDNLKTNNRIASTEQKIKIEPLQFTKLNTDNLIFKEFPSPKISEVPNMSVEPAIYKTEQVSDKIARLDAIPYTSTLQVETTDYDFVSRKYDIVLALNEGDFPTIYHSEKKSFASRFVSSFASKLIPQRGPSNKSFLEYSIDGYNLLADREVEVEKQYDSQGNIITYNVNGEIINFSRKAKTAPQN